MESNRWRWPKQAELEQRIDRSLRELYAAADKADAVLITAHAQGVLDSWNLLSMDGRNSMRQNTIFRTLPVIEHLSDYLAVTIIAAWGTLQALDQGYMLTDRATGEIITTLFTDDIIVEAAWEDDGGA